jgi:hypothetical protein
MAWHGWPVVIGLAIGCGPAVTVPGDEHGDGSTGAPASDDGPPTTTVGSTAMGDSVDPDPSTTVMTTSPTSSSSEGGVDTSTEGGSTTDPFECSCPPNVPIEFEDELERGFTPAQALAIFDDTSYDFYWTAYDGQPMTTLHLEVAYLGGPVAQGPGGSDGCQFISGPCDDGVVMDVELRVSTDDGWLIWTTPAQLVGVVDGDLSLRVPGVATDGNTGSLPMQPLHDAEGTALTLSALDFWCTRSSFGERPYTDITFAGHTVETDDFVFLGSTAPP